uniref:Uncharacterized protein n=1 Tax=viral metagenome TaxID=1070528 RepID=A0A6C0JBD9_9ZZZZ
MQIKNKYLIFNSILNIMDNKLKYNAYLLCERIRALTQELDKSIKDISHKTAIENDELYDKVYDKTYEKVYKPPAGISGTAWDNAIIQWKSSLRRPW